VHSGLFLASLGRCVDFPCAWFGRPLLSSFCCCSCFVLD
jgi:hypothetical protein